MARSVPAAQPAASALGAGPFAAQVAVPSVSSVWMPRQLEQSAGQVAAQVAEPSAGAPEQAAESQVAPAVAEPSVAAPLAQVAPAEPEEEELA